MKIVSTFHQPSSVSHSLRCNLSQNPDLHFLVIAKTNRLEVFALLADGLKLQCSQEIWGRITSLQAVPSDINSSRSNIAVTTDHPDPQLIVFHYEATDAENDQSSSGSKKLIPSAFLSLHERGSRPSEFFSGALVNHEREIMIISSYVGKLKVCELGDSGKILDLDSSVRELNILSMCFLYTAAYKQPVLAILHRDHTQRIVLISHDFSVTDNELSSLPSPVLPEVTIRDPYANLLIPVAPQTGSSWGNNGGVIVLGGTKIFFYACEHVDRKQKRKKSNITHADVSDEKKKRRRALMQIDWIYSDISAWEQIDNFRFVIGDSYGRMALLYFLPQSEKMEVLYLGETSPASCITLLSSEYIFVGSHFGDSQLIRLNITRSSVTETFLEVVDQYKNISPIMDALIADIDGSGQPQIVTCSGGNGSGSVRIIRNGANYELDAAFEGVSNISNLFSLKRQFNDSFHTYVLGSTPVGTHLYEMHPPSSTEPAVLIRLADNFIPDLKRASHTLAAANVAYRTVTQGTSEYHDSTFIVQVLSHAILLIDISTGTSVSEQIFDGGDEIIAADLSPSQVCVGLRGGRLILFNLERDQIELKFEVPLQVSGKTAEISTVGIIRPDRSEFFGRYVVVGLWNPHELRVYRMTDRELIGEPIILQGLPRSILSQTFGNPSDMKSHVLVGQGNGTVSVFSCEKGVLTSKKVMHLGNSPIFLTHCMVNGQMAVFAAGEWSSIIYWDKDSPQYSPVPLKDVIATSNFIPPSSSPCLVFSLNQGLSIGRIKELDKLHIRTINMGSETPIRIAHDPESQNFAIGYTKSQPCEVDRVSELSSSLKIIDSSFQLISSYPLERNEELSALNRVTLECGDYTEAYFVSGTYYFDASEREPSKGRLLLFRVRPQQSSEYDDLKSLKYLVTANETSGSVYAIDGVNGKLVAAINSSVAIYSLENPSPAANTSRLTKLAEWNHNYFVTSLAVRDNIIITGDAISSLAVLKFGVNNILETLARDYGPLWPLALGFFDDNTIVGANSESNLFSFRIQPMADKFLLERDGGYHLDDNVNKFISGSLASSDSGYSFITRQMFFTASGRIGVVIDTDEQLSLHLSALQRNLENVILGPGEKNHAVWRAPISGNGRSDAQAVAYGFLDGDLLERFLDLPIESEELQKTLSGESEPEKLKKSYNELRSILEALQSMH